MELSLFGHAYPGPISVPCDPAAVSDSTYSALKRLIRVATDTELIGYDQLLDVMGRDAGKWTAAHSALIAVVAAKNGRLEEASSRYPHLLDQGRMITEVTRKQQPDLWSRLGNYHAQYARPQGEAADTTRGSDQHQPGSAPRGGIFPATRVPREGMVASRRLAVPSVKTNIARP